VLKHPLRPNHDITCHHQENIMANTIHTTGLSEVKSIVISARTYEDIAAEHNLPEIEPRHRHDIDHSDAAEKMLAQKKRVPDLPDATDAAVRDAHEVIAEDKCLPRSHRLLALMHMIGSMYEETDAIEIIDMLCAGAARKIERKDKDMLKAVRELRQAREADRETEIGSASYQDAEDRAVSINAKIDLWREFGDTAKRAFVQTAQREWQDRTTGANVPDIGVAYEWEKQLRTLELMKRTRIAVFGGNEGIPLLEKRLSQYKAKFGDKLALATGDAESGFEAHVRKWATKNGVFCVTVPLPDKFAASRFFDRNRIVFQSFKPDGVALMGGGGVQGNMIELAHKANLKVDAVVLPAGWVKTEHGLRRMSLAETQAELDGQAA
jgi:hypothetical protein